jgi:glycosyltransferase involved in cell wall biosynthesis
LRHAPVIYPGTPIVSPRERMSDHPLVVFAGRLVTGKGADVLLKAFAIVAAENPACRLVIVGDGPQRPALRQLSEKLALGHCVTFSAHLTHDESLKAVRQAWVVCVPSLWDEPFGLIAAEAQMNGVAVIASNTGGLQEIVRDQETGFLVEPGHSDALAKSIGQVLANRNNAIALGTAGHSHARERFSVEAFGDQFERLYRSILAGKLNVGEDHPNAAQDQSSPPLEQSAACASLGAPIDTAKAFT